MTDSSVKVQPSTGTSDPQVATEILPDGTQAQKIEIVDANDNKAGVSATGALRVDGSGVTQPVSFAGGITANIGTTNGLALDATLTGGTQKTKIVDSGGANLATVSAAGALKVDGSGVTQPVSLAGDQAVNAVQLNGNTINTGAGASGTGTARVAIATDGQGQIADNNVFTDGTTRLDMAGYILDETAGTALTENDAAAARIDSKRAQVFALEDATTRGQRAAVSAAGALAVNIAQAAGASVATGHGTAAGALRVELPTDGTGVVGLAAGTNAIGNVGLAPQTSGGCLISRTLSAASTNATSVKASAGQVFGVRAFNANAATRYLKLYNKASAPTVGTDTPVDTIPLPSGVTTGFMLDSGVAFGTGIALALTTGIADLDTGAVGANDVAVAVFYK